MCSINCSIKKSVKVESPLLKLLGAVRGYPICCLRTTVYYSLKPRVMKLWWQGMYWSYSRGDQTNFWATVNARFYLATFVPMRFSLALNNLSVSLAQPLKVNTWGSQLLKGVWKNQRFNLLWKGSQNGALTGLRGLCHKLQRKFWWNRWCWHCLRMLWGGFKMTQGFCEKYERLIRDLWWGDEEGHRRVHWMSWEQMTKPKRAGGIGFQDMKLFNQALVARQACRLIQRPESLCARFLKTKYYPNGELLDTLFVSDASPVWRGIEHGLELLKKGRLLYWELGMDKRLRSKGINGSLEKKD